MGIDRAKKEEMMMVKASLSLSLVSIGNSMLRFSVRIHFVARWLLKTPTGRKLLFMNSEVNGERLTVLPTRFTRFFGRRDRVE